MSGDKSQAKDAGTDAAPSANDECAASAPVAPASGSADQNRQKDSVALTPVTPRTPEAKRLTTERNFVKNLAFDQVHIWESPFRMRDQDAAWALPFGMLTSGLVLTDPNVSKSVATPGRLSESKHISDAGLFGFIGAGAGVYGFGLITHDDHKRETGLLSGEAMINATLVSEALKYSLGRERPFEGDHFGHIGKSGSSFPSGHAIDSWAIATVFAHEYPNPFMQVAAYGLASAVAATRVTAGQHFPSDVLVGSTLGYLIGRKMYRDHHDNELDGGEYGTFVSDTKRDAAHAGSAYVPLESWVYPAIDRLAALGVIGSNFDSERPFTRLECARLVDEATENLHYEDAPQDVLRTLDALQKEFSRESEVWGANSDNRAASIESVYSRVTEISGPVLRDGYHFGQTLVNDYGRPYGRGFNNVTGLSVRATSGPLVFYFRGEYQLGAGNPAYSAAQQTAISKVDQNSIIPDRYPNVSRLRALDAYVGVNLDGNQLTVGQESLWWGPGSSGPLMFSNNAEPLRMVRLQRAFPIKLPGILSFLGAFSYDAFFGQTDGHHFIVTVPGGRFFGPDLHTQPFVQGQRFSIKPTPNFEIGISRTGVFGGDGTPLTAHQFFTSTFEFSAPLVGGRDPGDRRTGFDMTYRLPFVRDWLTFYLEEFSEDEISPLFFPRKAAMRPGIYLPKIPKFNRLDLRVEGLYSDPPSSNQAGTFYYNVAYRDGFTKNGNIMGSWIGRDARGLNAMSRLWLSPRNTVEFGYRNAEVDPEFIGGGHYRDGSVKANFFLRDNVAVSGLLQYENWRFPVLAPQPQTNLTSSIQITLMPGKEWRGH